MLILPSCGVMEMTMYHQMHCPRMNRVYKINMGLLCGDTRHVLLTASWAPTC